MSTTSTFALAVALAASSGALAATKQQSAKPSHDVYNPRRSAAHIQLAPGAALEGRPIRVDDCIHVPFPQCN